MKTWGYFFILNMICATQVQVAQASWLDSAKNLVRDTFDEAQNTFIYDETPVQNFAEPLRQQILHRVNIEHNQRAHGLHDTSIRIRNEGFACDELNINEKLESEFIKRCDIESIRDSCRSAVKQASQFSYYSMPQNPHLQERATLQQLKSVQKKMIKNLNSIIDSRENCYSNLKRVRVNNFDPICMNSLQETLENMTEQVAAVCTVHDFDRQIDSFISRMRDRQGTANQIFVATRQYVQVRNTELEIANLLLSFTESIQARLASERATASSEPATSQQATQGK